MKRVLSLKNNAAQAWRSKPLQKLEGFGNSDQIIETTKQIDILSRMLVVQSKSLEEIQLLAEKKEEFLAAIPSIQPIKS